MNNQQQQDPILMTLGYVQLLQSIVSARKFMEDHYQFITSKEKHKIELMLTYLSEMVPEYDKRK